MCVCVEAPVLGYQLKAKELQVSTRVRGQELLALFTTSAGVFSTPPPAVSTAAFQSLTGIVMK